MTTQLAFYSQSLLDIWQSVDISWKEPLKVNSGGTGFLSLQGHMVQGYPGVPPLQEALAALQILQSAGKLSICGKQEAASAVF